MANRLLRIALRRTLSQVRYVTPVHPRVADGLVADVYDQVERDFGMLAPPVALHSPAPRVLAAGWALLRESLVAGSVDRPAKEAVAAAVSVANTCPYCVEVHSATLGGLVAGPDAAAIAADDLGAVTDGRIRDIALWAKAGATRQDLPLPDAPTSSDMAELIGVAVTFQYLNRMVNVFLGDSPLPPKAPAGARRVLGRLMGRDASREIRPGASLDLLAPAGAPPPWAVGNPVVGDAFARAGTAIESTGVVTEPVRELLAVALADWDGHPPGLGRGWVEEAVRALPAAERAAGRLALLIAKASYQVDDDVVADFRRTSPGDAELVELAAFASLAAARRLGDRMWLRQVTAER